MVEVNREVADLAAEYRAADLGLRMPDALIIATGVYLGVDAILTADKKLSRLGVPSVQLVC